MDDLEIRPTLSVAVVMVAVSALMFVIALLRTAPTETLLIDIEASTRSPDAPFLPRFAWAAGGVVACGGAEGAEQ